MKSKIKRLVAASELLVAAMFWGFGFIAVFWAFEAMDAFEMTFLRFAIAGLLGAVFLLSRKGRQAWLENWRRAFWPGVLIAATILLQTWGMHYTTATKSGFITTLYVVLVPLLESYWVRRKLPWQLWFCVLTAIAGTALIVNIAAFGKLNTGDVLVFLCALAAALQIFILGFVSPQVKQPFIFNLVQSAWAALVCAPVLFFSPFFSKLAAAGQWSLKAWLGLLSLSFGSTVLAFYLQVRAQRALSPTVSSLLFLMESPFAMIFAIILLGEALGLTEAVGAALIFLSAMAASLIEARRKKF